MTSTSGTWLFWAPFTQYGCESFASLVCAWVNTGRTRHSTGSPLPCLPLCPVPSCPPRALSPICPPHPTASLGRQNAQPWGSYCIASSIRHIRPPVGGWLGIMGQVTHEPQRKRTWSGSHAASAAVKRASRKSQDTTKELSERDQEPEASVTAESVTFKLSSEGDTKRGSIG